MKLLNNTQSGRSMVEMLGVLAIIGVLSVGGIAGYSKAMFKYKINQTLDIISQTIANIIELKGKNINELEIETAQDMVNFGVIPDCDVNHTDLFGQKGRACPIPLGEISFTALANEVIENLTLDIYFTQNPVESCVAFFSSEIYKNVPENWWHPTYINIGGTSYEYTLGGFIGVTTSSEGNIIYAKSELLLGGGPFVDAKSELTAADIANACSTCHGSEYCNINWGLTSN